MVARPGASRNSRARPSESRSPRLLVTSACNSSSTTRLSVPNRYGASARGEQQRELLGRGQQDVGRIAALALALRGRRVAGAGLDADRQPHLGDRRFEVARDVDRQRLERRDVERVQALRAAQVLAGRDACGAASRRARKAPPGSAGSRPASCRRRSARSAAPSGRRGRATAVQAGARAASSRAARTSAKSLRQQRRGFGLSARFMPYRLFPESTLR